MGITRMTGNRSFKVALNKTRFNVHPRESSFDSLSVTHGGMPMLQLLPEWAHHW